MGPHGLCRPLDENQRFPRNNSPLAPYQGCSKFPGTECALARQRAPTGGHGPARERPKKTLGKGSGARKLASAPSPGPFWGKPGRRKGATPPLVDLGLSVLPNGREFRTTVARTSPSLLGQDARPGASVGASSAHANGQRRSRQFRVGYLNLPKTEFLEVLIIDPNMEFIGTLRKSRFWQVKVR